MSINKKKGFRLSYLGSGSLLKKAIEKYGKENFKKEILKEFSNEEDTRNYERYLIEKCNAVKSPEYYNLGPGGYGGGGFGRHIPLYVKDKIANSLMGRKHSEESKLKMRVARLGLVYTEKYKSNLSKATKKHWDSKSPEEKIQFAEKSRQSALLKKKVLSEKEKERISKERSRLSREEVLEIFSMKSNGSSYKDISSRFGINFSSISEILNKKTYKWIWNENSSV